MTARSAPYASRRLLFEEVAPDQWFVFSPLSGAVDSASTSEVGALRRLQQGDASGFTAADLDELTKKLIVFRSLDEEEACLQALVQHAWDGMVAAEPEMFSICPTLACNLACDYCFEGDSLLDKHQGVMTSLQVEQVFAAIAQLRTKNSAGASSSTDSSDPSLQPAPWISLFGGEPLLPSTKQCVRIILEHAASGGFLVGATTNGVNITRFADLFTEYADIIPNVQITLDGVRAVHDARRHRLGGQGTFDEIVAGIDFLLELDIHVDLRVNLDSRNLDGLPELADFIVEKGWTEESGVLLTLAPITMHKAGGCSSAREAAMSELDLAARLMDMMDSFPNVAATAHLGFLRHLSHLVSVLEPEHAGQSRPGSAGGSGPRYWYCEAGTSKHWVFTPQGYIFTCTESVQLPTDAVGRFEPELDLWTIETRKWLGRTILSHQKCCYCSISTLCGGGCNHAALDQANHVERSPLSLIQLMPRDMLNSERPWRHRTAPDDQKIFTVDPFCNQAEETVRKYMRWVGKRRFKTPPSALNYELKQEARCAF